uniref:Wsv037-like protein n=1 Tax=Trachysalambria curvirostris majanivirus TaxID=2984281 RepID=A0A9C7EYX7_9VIRU|nr:MAG: wsv037-like protein [Trachysalambria curvirostris majanivirus]
MEKFFADCISGVDILSSFRLKSFRYQDNLMVIRDYSKTIPGVSSELFLVRGGGPSSRERMILSRSMIDVFEDYKNSVTTVAPISWQVFNDRALHTYIINNLTQNNLYSRNYFSTDPLPGIGELVSFKYRGGIPQNIIFPIGSSTINWLSCVKSAKRMGEIFLKRPLRSNIYENNNILGKCEKNEIDIKRIRFWRYFYFIEDVVEKSGMMHFNPFSSSHISFDKNLTNKLPDDEHDFSLAFIGDSFSRESIILSDIIGGGKTSNFFYILRSILQYNYDDRQINDVTGDINNPLRRITKILDSSCNIGQNKESIYNFLSSVLDFSHREILNNLTISPLALKEEIEELLMIIAIKQEWILLYSILQQIQFNILHLLGYSAHRILIFKLFVPVLIAVMFANGNLSQTVLHAAAYIEVAKRQAGGFTLSNILNYSNIKSNPNGTARHFSEFENNDPEGYISSTLSVPIAIDVANIVKDVSMMKQHIDICQQVGLAIIKANSIVNDKIVNNYKREKKNDNRRQSRREKRHVNNTDTPNDKDKYGIKKMKVNDSSNRDNYDTNSGLLIEHYNDNSKNKDTVSNNLIIEENKNTHEKGNQQEDSIYNTNPSFPDKRINIDHKETSSTKQYVGSINKIQNPTLQPSVLLKGILTTIEKCFTLKEGTILNSIHGNIREYVKGDSNSDIGPSIDFSNRQDVTKRFLEIIIDSPSPYQIKKDINTAIIEKQLHNEHLMEKLYLNPVFRAIVGTNDPLERVIVLWNITKYINMAVIGLITVDLASLIDQRKGARKALRRGTIMKQNEFNYREAGNTPGEMRDTILPECISKLKCINGKTAKNQKCDHFFCKSLRLLYMSIDPDKATDIFIDDASRGTLLKLRDFCNKRDKLSMKDWDDNVFIPIMKGDDWVTFSKKQHIDLYEFKNFSWVLKRMVIDMGLLSSQISKDCIEFESDKLRVISDFSELILSNDDDYNNLYNHNNTNHCHKQEYIDNQNVDYNLNQNGQDIQANKFNDNYNNNNKQQEYFNQYNQANDYQNIWPNTLETQSPNFNSRHIDILKIALDNINNNNI